MGIGRIAQAGSSVTHYYLSDGLGSAMALTDEAGDVDTTWDYDVFGTVRGMTGSQPNDFTFAGEQVDGSTGLQYLRARYYDAEVGRFISKDAFAGVVGVPATQNPYVYVGNIPTLGRDPSGNVWDFGSKESASADQWLSPGGPAPGLGQGCDMQWWYDWIDCFAGAPPLGITDTPGFVPPIGLSAGRGGGNFQKPPKHVVVTAPGKSIENFKKEYVGRDASRYNVEYDKTTGEVYLVPVRPGSGLPNIPTGITRQQFEQEIDEGFWE